MSGKKIDKDDDGRVIADMSGVEKPILLGFLSPSFRRSGDKTKTVRESLSENAEMSPEDRKWYVLGALKAALLIGTVFAVGLGLVILAMVFFWAR